MGMLSKVALLEMMRDVYVRVRGVVVVLQGVGAMVIKQGMMWMGT